ncbi:MAG: hypothetical protein IPP47_23585 [Bryobacterales bacterium]|nr:hypothetical protein [Bryobacterales bacterium]
MPLVRMTEKRLAANRANAKKSTGPRTPAGKARTCHNAAKHYLYARTHTIPPAWQDRIIPRVVEATAEFSADQRQRDLHARFLYFSLWAIELDALDEQYLQHSIDQCNGDFRRGAHNWYTQTPLARAFHQRRMHIARHCFRADRDITNYQRLAPPCAPAPGPSPPPPAPTFRQRRTNPYLT